MTSRRSFLAALGAALTLDPERLLWVPGAKLISIPAPQLRTVFDDEQQWWWVAVDHGVVVEWARFQDPISWGPGMVIRTELGQNWLRTRFPVQRMSFNGGVQQQ